MAPSPACIALIKRFEGCRLEAYLDSVGIPTIGYGHTRNVRLGDEVTLEEAEWMLQQDLKDVAAGILPLLLVEVTQGMFDAMCSFAFNLGVRALKNSTLLRKVNAGDKIGASEEFSKWVYAGGQKLPGLVKRRQAEADLFMSQAGGV